MMFQGSENVPEGRAFSVHYEGRRHDERHNVERADKLFRDAAGKSTSAGSWLESDRMRSLAVTQENLDNQREAVKEEKRLRYDNQPYGQIFDLINEMIYKNFANSHSTIGSMEHLDEATVEDVQEFFRIYYAPNNAVLVDLRLVRGRDGKDLVETYFGDIASQPLPPELDVSEPTEVAETYREWEDKLAPFPGVSDRLEDTAASHAGIQRPLSGGQDALRRRQFTALSETGQR